VIAGQCFAHAADRGGLNLLLYDVTTLYFEAENEDDLRKVGYSKERVRREALVDRVEVKDLHGDSVAAGLRS